MPWTSVTRTSNPPWATRTCSRSFGATSAGSRTTRPSRCCTTAYPRSSVDCGDSARTWAARCATPSDSRRRRTSTRSRLRERNVATCWRCGVNMASGSVMTARVRVATSSRRSVSSRPVTARRARPRRSCSRARSSAASGTTRLPASVGVDARQSATKSSSGVSDSWPMALTTGVRACATARSRVSLLKASSSSTEPPPRAMTMTSTDGSRIQLRDRGADLGHRRGALDRDLSKDEPHRRPPASRVLHDVSGSGALPTGDEPDAGRDERQRALALRREQPLGRQPLPEDLDAGQQVADPEWADPAGIQLQGPAAGPERAAWRGRPRGRRRRAARPSR